MPKLKIKEKFNVDICSARIAFHKRSGNRNSHGNRSFMPKKRQDRKDPALDGEKRRLGLPAGAMIGATSAFQVSAQQKTSDEFRSGDFVHLGRRVSAGPPGVSFSIISFLPGLSVIAFPIHTVILVFRLESDHDFLLSSTGRIIGFRIDYDLIRIRAPHPPPFPGRVFQIPGV
jgi:hypothetical protein